MNGAMNLGEFLENMERPERVLFNIEDSNNLLRRGLKYFLGDNYKWLPEYDEIADWMSDNDGRGLLCMGDCGRGKTLICYHILKPIFSCCLMMNYLRYDAVDIGANLDTIKDGCPTLIDDVGTELPYSLYGMKRESFAEIVDNAEKKGQLLVITTNLSAEKIIERYGKRTFDRLKAITKPVFFSGESLRK